MKISPMTATAALGVASLATPGYGQTADYVRVQSLETFRHFHTPVSRSQPRAAAMEALVGVYEQCRRPDWDGHGAASVEQTTYVQAYRLLESLPDMHTMPTIGAEPDGQITLEWHHSAYRTLSVSVSPEGDLHYAALLGASRAYGTEPFLGQVPEALLRLVYNVALG
jgi:hypothetical protein